MDVLGTMLDPMADSPEELQARVMPLPVLQLTRLGIPALANQGNLPHLEKDVGALWDGTVGHVTLAAVLSSTYKCEMSTACHSSIPASVYITST